MGFSKLFSYKSVDMPNKSGHDEFHRRYFSGDVGTLTPSFVDFLIPGDKVDLSGKFEIQLPPMATDFYGRINVRTELFYVPCRILFGGWKDFITYPAEGIEGPAPDDPNYHAKYLPGAEVDSGFSFKEYNLNKILDYSQPMGNQSIFSELLLLFEDLYNNAIAENSSAFVNSGSSSIGAGSLMDFLGFKVRSESGELNSDFYNNFGPLFNALQSDPDSPFDGTFRSLVETSETGYVNFYIVDGSQRWNNTDYSAVPQVRFYITRLDGTNVSLKVSFNDPNQSGSTDIGNVKINNILPAVCYHKIYDDWYRDPRIMKPLFPSALRSYQADTFLRNIAYIPKFSGGFVKKYYTDNELNFYDGKSLFDLRQRLWQKDYFTTMTAQPQAGDSMKVSFDVANESGEFTIASLRVANAMQQWLERNNLVSPRYGDVMFAQYGVYPSDAITDRSIYLGSQTIEVYNKAVYQQGSFDGNGANPFDSVGAKYGAPVAMDSGSFCNNYEVKEHGFLMALTSLVPEASYGSGTRRFWHYDTIADIAFPLLQGVGDQEVYAREIIDTYSGEGDKTVIGYQERYIEYKFIEDSVHGRLRDGENLSSFMLQRTFSEAPELGADFLEIPKDYLNQVGAVNADVSDYGYWGAVAWDYRKVSSLSSANATPTLGRMVDVHTISVPKGGTRL